MGADPGPRPGWSRTREYAEQQAQIHVSEAKFAELETQVEDLERRNLRLTRELMKETELRARSERQRDDAKSQNRELKELHEGTAPSAANDSDSSGSKSSKGTNQRRANPPAGGKVSTSRKRGAASTKPGDKTVPKPTPGQGAGKSKGTEGVNQGSRKRGRAR